MASVVTNTVSHNIPPLPVSIAAAPRVRPPRIPKGTPNANTNPQPDSPVPKNKIWVQGKWRERASRAAKQRQEIYSRRIEKALQHETLGMNIYAYNHIRTKQVVYSLTRHMDNNKIMQQLLFHGKKTVPRALRRDLWTPYFSLHFPQTEHGAEAGKLVYHRLRELSQQRQLSPPKDMVTTTQEDIDLIKSKLDPITLRDALEHREVRVPVVGQRLPMRLRAKRLMDQKATSVADVAFVLQLYLDGPNPAEQRAARVQKFQERMSKMGRRAKTRMTKIRQLEARKRDLIATLASQATSIDIRKGHLTLNRYVSARISAEHHGTVAKSGGVKNLELHESAKAAKAEEAEIRGDIATVQAQIDALLTGKTIAEEEPLREPVESSESVPAGNAVDPNMQVRVMWADIRDGTYAKEWPVSVLHGELERWSQSQSSKGTQRSIHIIGGEEGSGWARDPKEIVEERERTEELYEERQTLAKELEGKVSDAVSILRERTPETSTRTFVYEELTQEQPDLDLRESEENLIRPALEAQWFALEPKTREGIDMNAALAQAQILRIHDARAYAVDKENAKNPRRAAALRAEEARAEGVELPQSGWFSRLRALFFRR